MKGNPETLSGGVCQHTRNSCPVIYETGCGKCGHPISWHRIEEHRMQKSRLTNKKRTKPRRGAVKDPAYLEWLRTLPCCVCAEWHGNATNAIAGLHQPIQHSPTEAAHVGARGLGQRCDDREALPICTGHHRTGPLAHHILGKKFWSYHGLDRERLIAEYNHTFDSSISGMVISV